MSSTASVITTPLAMIGVAITTLIVFDPPRTINDSATRPSYHRGLGVGALAASLSAGVLAIAMTR
jgi:hypothetical protein